MIVLLHTQIYSHTSHKRHHILVIVSYIT